MDIVNFGGGGQNSKTPKPIDKKIGVVITSAMPPRMPKLKPHWGRGGVCVNYHILFVTPNFACVPRLNCRTSGGSGRTCPPPGAIEISVHLTSVMSLWTCHSSFLVTENGHLWQLHQYCKNGLQIENKSQEILHHLGTQKDAKLYLKCIKIRLAAGLCPDPLEEL